MGADMVVWNEAKICSDKMPTVSNPVNHAPHVALVQSRFGSSISSQVRSYPHPDPVPLGTMSWTDPVARLQDQEGLEVNSAGFTKSPFIWFRDGTVVIVCTDCEVIKMGFRVNQSILSLNSSVFKDMFCVVQPDQVNAGEVFEGCPIVYLPDDPFAMNHLLRMLYERRRVN